MQKNRETSLECKFKVIIIRSTMNKDSLISRHCIMNFLLRMYSIAYKIASINTVAKNSLRLSYLRAFYVHYCDSIAYRLKTVSRRGNVGNLGKKKEN